MSEVTELKNCPFCGGEAKIVAPLSYGNVRAGECGNSDNCAATGPWSSNEAEAIAAWNTRAEASSAEPVAWMYRRDGRNVILRERLHRDGVLQGGTGWTETPLYAHPPAAPDTVTLDRALVEEALVALRLLQSYGCPACSGDCASANPPMIVCPMAGSQAAIFRLTEALK